MGDRANVILKSNGEQVCLYTHWYGTELPKTVQTALVRGKSRWEDFQYLSRIVFCEMIQGSVMSETGFGISQTIGDGANKVIIIDCDERSLTINNKKPISLEDYVKLESPEF